MTAATKIGKYEIRGQIGRGAMGVVYEGFDPAIERRVAIKNLRLELFEPSQIADVCARFKREAQAAGKFAHPHIVTIYDYGEHEGAPYIAMEYLSGNELRHYLERGSRLSIAEITRLMTQLLGALAYAHERKVIHRDIKPANIFVLDDGSLKVVDFGIARVEASNLTDTGALLGTPAYMSPEQFLALPVDERSDIFSAGVILYELLTGDKPFTGSVTTVMQKVLRQEPVEPSVLNPTLSTAWDDVVRQAMAKKPDARFQSAREFAEKIKQVSDGTASGVPVRTRLAQGDAVTDQTADTLRPGADTQAIPHAQRSLSPAPAHPAIKNPGSSSRKRGWLVAGIVAVFVVGAAALYLSQRTREELTAPPPASKTVQRDDGAAEKALAERAAAERAVTEKAAADARAAAEKAAKATEKEVKEKVASEVARLEKIRADKAAAERAAAAKPAAESTKQGVRPAVEAKQAGQSRLPQCAGSFAAASWTNCFGELTNANGLKYAGEFREGKFSGQGSLTYPNGVKYVGEFRDGVRNGQGTATLPNGMKYVGEFKEGKRSGQGIEYLPNGTVLRSGAWQGGEFVKGR